MKDIENYDYVICQVCKKKLKQITHLHLKHHNLTVEDYKKLYPNSKIRCEKSKQIHLKHQNETNNIRYGVNRPLQNKEIKEKADNTLYKNHKVLNAYNLEKCRVNSQNTCLERYGAKTPFESYLQPYIESQAQKDDSKIKRKNSFENTCMKKYGVKNNLYLKTCINKRLNTMYNRYGYTSVFSIDSILKKACINSYKTNSSNKINKCEKIILDIIDEYAYYTGNGSFWVTFKNGKRKNPDFVFKNCNKVIEHYGDYWHKNDSEENIINLYNEIGYKCLVIWEHELKDIDNVTLKILNFINQ